MGQDVRSVMTERVFLSPDKSSDAELHPEDDLSDVRAMSESCRILAGHVTAAANAESEDSAPETGVTLLASDVEEALSPARTPGIAGFTLFDDKRQKAQLGSPEKSFVEPTKEYHEKTQEIIPAVPNIVVEHVFTRDVLSHRSLTPPLDVQVSSKYRLAASPTSSARQTRALSDSSIHDLERWSPSHEFKHMHPESWKCLADKGGQGQGSDIFMDSIVPSEGTCHKAALSNVATKRRSFRLSVVIEPEHDAVESFNIDSSTKPFQHSQRTPFIQEKSPKTYWMRRHSDSNLSARQAFSSFRAGPYPIRSRSTGDSIPVSPLLPPDPGLTVSMEVSNLENREKGETGESQSYTENRHSGEERSSVLHEKHLKLKKYLQARYQTSLLEMRQSSDADDVFMDRSPDPASQGPVSLSESSYSKILVNAPLPVTPSSSSKSVVGKLKKIPSKRLAQLDHSRGFEEEENPFYEHSQRLSLETLKQKQLLEAHDRKTKEGSCSSELPVFIFPSVSSGFHSDLPVCANPSKALERQAAASSFPSGNWSMPVSHPVMTPWIQLNQELAPKHTSISLQLEMPLENPTLRGSHLQRQPWEGPDEDMTRLQSFGSLATCSSASENPTFALNRFISSPALSEFPSTVLSVASGWQEPGDTKSALISSASLQLVSGKSLKFRRSYNLLGEAGTDKGERSSLRSQFTCPLCSQEFSSCKYLTNHMACHVNPDVASKDSPSAGETSKVHLCQVCNRVFSRSDMLTRHTRLHTGLRPYECHLCGQVFSRSDHLHTHLRTHTGEKPYKCTTCPYAAPRRDMVTRHMRIHNRVTQHRGRRSSSDSSDVPPSPVYSEMSSLSSDEVHQRIRLLSTTDPAQVERQAFFGHNSPSTAADTELGQGHMMIAYRTCSLTSSDSIEGPDMSNVFPACHAWSSTSTESFESFSSSRTRDRLSSTDSPDVFCRAPQRFFSSIRAAGQRSETAPRNVRSPSVDRLSVEMQTSFERCSVTTPEAADGQNASKQH